jgi:hypothetical protein
MHGLPQTFKNITIFINAKNKNEMARFETRRLKPSLLTEDTDGFSALQDIPDYAPANADYSVANGSTAQTAMLKAQQSEAQAEAAYKAARDNSVAAEWDFHNFTLGAKKQVMAQYGDSSNQIQGLGLKKKTEYKTPSKKNGTVKPVKS